MLELNDILMILGTMIILWVLMKNIVRRRTRGRTTARPVRAPTNTRETATELRGLTETMRQLEVGLEELSREVNARLDTKMHVLNRLVAEAGELPEAKDLDV